MKNREAIYDGDPREPMNAKIDVKEGCDYGKSNSGSQK